MVSLALLWKEFQNHSAASDAECLARFRTSRDPDAFTILVHRYSALVRSVCRRQLRTLADIDDAYQTTFAALALKPHLVRDGAALPGWLHTTAYRVAVRLRHRKPLAELPDIAAKPTSDASLQQGLAALDECLQKLPEKLRRPIVVCYLQEETQENAARILGLSISTLRRRLEAGRSRLKRMLEAQGIELGAILALSAATTASQAGLPSAAAILAFSTTLPTHLKPILQGVMMTLLMEKVRLVLLVVGLGGIAATGTGLVAVTATAQSPIGNGIYGQPVIMVPNGPQEVKIVDPKTETAFSGEELDHHIQLTELQIEAAKLAMKRYTQIKGLQGLQGLSSEEIDREHERHLRAKQDLLIAERRLLLLKSNLPQKAPKPPTPSPKPARDPELQKLLEARVKAYAKCYEAIVDRSRQGGSHESPEVHITALKKWRDARLELQETPGSMLQVREDFAKRVRDTKAMFEALFKAGLIPSHQLDILDAELLDIAVQDRKAQLEAK
jgi:RNA polymerase sigma factor (sigma-70 family)